MLKTCNEILWKRERRQTLCLTIETVTRVLRWEDLHEKCSPCFLIHFLFCFIYYKRPGKALDMWGPSARRCCCNAQEWKQRVPKNGCVLGDFFFFLDQIPKLSNSFPIFSRFFHCPAFLGIFFLLNEKYKKTCKRKPLSWRWWRTL